MTGGRERIRHYIERFHPGCAGRIDVAALHRHKTALYGQMARGALRLRPGVVRLLREAHGAGLRQAIVTTTSRSNVETLLAPLLPDWQEIFSAFATGEDVRRKKPAPDLYLIALERLRLDPGDCLAIEDSALGLRAARGAGVPVVITFSSYTMGEDFTGALAVLDHLGEPGTPCRRLDGPPPVAGFVTLEDLLRWHAEHLQQRS